MHDIYEGGTGRIDHAPSELALRQPHERALSYDSAYPGGVPSDAEQEQGFDLRLLLRILWQQKWVVLAAIALGLALCAAYLFTVKPLYRSGATIEFQKQEAQIVENADFSQAVIADTEFLATQKGLIQSRIVATRVAESLGPLAKQAYCQSVPGGQACQEAIVTKLLENLRVTPQGRSRIFTVQYTDTSPEMTAMVANSFSESFIDIHLERKYAASEYAREFLEERLQESKGSLEEAEKSLVDYAEQNNILELSNREDGASLSANSLILLNEELAGAKSAEEEARQIYLQLSQNRDTAQVRDSDDMKRLRARLSELRSDYEDKLNTFKPGYPAMLKLQAQIDAVQAEIQSEKRSIVASAESDYRTEAAKVSALERRVNVLKNDLRDLRNKRIEYTILEREVSTIRSQYDALLQRLKEVSLAKEIGSSQAAVLDRAIVPAEPYTPKKLRSVILALVLSSLLGAGIAVMLHYFDDTIKTPDDVKAKMKMPLLGTTPQLEKKNVEILSELQSFRSDIKEAYQNIQASLQFSSEEGLPKSVLITSCTPAEGKTSSALSLAFLIAKSGKNVIIIDADMRKPSFMADLKESVGLSGLLSSSESLDDNILYSDTSGLYLLPSGPIPPNPPELLSGGKMRDLIRECEEKFDVVIVDAPPLLSLADVPIMASMVRKVVAVVKSKKIRTPVAKALIQKILDARGNVAGVVLTHFNHKHSGSDYQYYGYGYGVDEGGTKKVEKSESGNRNIRLFDDRSDS